MTGKAPSKKLYQTIIAVLQAEIAQGVYRAGDRLPPERLLVDRFEVSRLTVREAMIGMEILGLVETRRGAGVFVTVNAVEVHATADLNIGAFELTEARRLIEGECAALAAASVTQADLEALNIILEKMTAENQHEIHDEIADREFHLRIAEATQNQAMLLVVETLWDVRNRSPLCAEMLQRSRSAGVKPIVDDHRRIVDALTRRNPSEARRAMRDHLGRVIENLLAVTELDAIRRVKQETAKLRNRLEHYPVL